MLQITANMFQKFVQQQVAFAGNYWLTASPDIVNTQHINSHVGLW
jgi:hypothetical protein